MRKALLSGCGGCENARKVVAITPKPLLVDRLFVYGTLRPGSKNEQAERLAKTARHVGCATIRGRLYRVVHYPALAPPQSNEDRVTGDVFEGMTVELFERLDEYEGAEYSRQLAEVTMEDGRIFQAYFYGYTLPTNQLEWIPSGDWRIFSSLMSQIKDD